MKFAKIEKHLTCIPFIPAHAGRQLYDFVRDLKPKRSLELGFAHDVSTCYIAVALEERTDRAPNDS